MFERENKMYYTYLLRCEDNSIYTGITTNIDRRMKEHFEKDKKCAKYTRRHTAKKFEIAWESKNRSLASKLEYQIKKLSKIQKEEIIHNPELLKKLIPEKIENTEYYVWKGENIRGGCK